MSIGGGMEPTEKDENIHSEDWDLLHQTRSPKRSRTFVDVCERLVAVADIEQLQQLFLKVKKRRKRATFYHEKKKWLLAQGSRPEGKIARRHFC